MELHKDESGVWHVSFYTDKGTRTRTTKCTNREQALQACRIARIPELEAAAKAKALNAEALSAIMAGRRVSLGAACDEWKQYCLQVGTADSTARNHAYVVTRLIRGRESKPVPSLTTEMLSDYVNSADGRSLSNRKQRLAAIRSFFKFCAAKAYVVGNPAALVKINLRRLSHSQKEGGKRRAFTDEEYAKLLTGTEGFWHHASAFSYWLGLRLSDICNLEWDSFTAEGIIIHTQKTGARVVLPITDPLTGGGALALNIFTLMAERTGRSRYVFPEERAVYADIKQRGKLSVYFGRKLARLNMEGVSFHCLRHTFVTRLKKAGKSIEDIAKLAGHADVKTTAGYAH